METRTTIFVVALYASAGLFLAAKAAIKFMTGLFKLTMHRRFILINEPNVRGPIDTGYMHPAHIGVDNCASKIVAHLAFKLLWELYWLPHQLCASLAKPLIGLRKLLEYVMAVTRLVDCYIAKVAHDQVVFRLIILEVIEAYVAHDLCIVVVLRDPNFCF
jgi:hypothetical protein